MYSALADKSDFLPKMDSDCNGRFILRRTDLYRIKKRLIINESKAEYDPEDFNDSLQGIKEILYIMKLCKTHRLKFSTHISFFDIKY